MWVINTEDKFGSRGPFECASCEELADAMQDCVRAAGENVSKT